MQYMTILIRFSFSFFRVTELESLGYIGRSVNKQNIHAMVERLAYSDWLILYYLAQVSQQIGIKKNHGIFFVRILCRMLHKNYSRSDYFILYNTYNSFV